MSLRSKLNAAKIVGDMVLAVRGNTGIIPRSFKGMVLIEPTSVCNLSCPLCPTGTGTLVRKRKYIDLNVVDRIVDLTAPFAQGFVMNLFGEPTFHPEFERILEKTRHLPTWLSTNLSYGKEAVDLLARWDNLRVICSIDTLVADEYPKYRVGGNYEAVMANLRVLAQGDCQVFPQFLVRPGEYDEESFMAFAREYGIPAPNVIVKTKLEEFRLDPTDRPVPGLCHSFYTGLYFDCDGYLLPCCNNVRKELQVMHIGEIESLDDILSGPRAVKIRKQLATDKNVFTSCGRCKGHDFWAREFKDYLKAAKHLVAGPRDSDKPTRVDV